ncbi:vWA domain-containing protein [Saccharospirillum impatiens]|uniref:vWA domain-containing protein n=1 Tax=Saccharospirillum impatiens TaxID=169438 RepID=UPI0004120A21|nr:VWA domain-containing protein [Saccharospirillum impatiens]
MSNRIHSLWLTTAVLAACSSQEPMMLESDQGQPDAPTTEVRPVLQTDAAGEAEKSASGQEYAATLGDLAQPAARSDSMASMLYPVPSPESPVYSEPDRERYEAAEVNPIHRVAETPVSTFSIDVDTASYSNMRRFLGQGVMPPEDSIRVEELLNYFDYHYAGPGNSEHPFAINTQLAPTPWNENTQLLRIGVQGYEVEPEALPSMNLVFLLDVSGSMNQADKLPLLQRAFGLLVDRLRPEDKVAIVVYAGASGVVLEPTGGDDRARIQQALNQLQAGGSTHGSAGIQLAYQVAEEHFRDGGINRVILGTDGDFNVGVTNLDDLKALIETKRESGVFFSALGFGTGNYNDQLMEELTNLGNGTAYYIDQFSEARKVFAEDLTGTLHTIAKDVKIQVEFNPDQVAEYRLIGYDNRQLRREDFNNDRVDAGDVGAGHSVTALYEVVPAQSDFRFNDPLRYQQSQGTDTPASEMAFVKLRYKLPDQDSSRLMTQPVEAGSAVQTMDEAMQFAAAVAGFGELLRGSYYVNDWSVREARELALAAIGEDAFGYRQELLQLMHNAEALSPF